MAARAIEVPFLTASRVCCDFEPEELQTTGFMLMVKIAVRNGVPVLILDSPCDYAVMAARRDNGSVDMGLLSRPKVDAHLFPHWPEPEPEKSDAA